MINLTISQIVHDYYLPEKRMRRRANTVEGYESSLNLYVLPRFGNCTLEDIRHDDIQVWVDDFEKPGAAEKAFKCLRQVVRWAMDVFGVFMADPTRKIELPRKPKYSFKTLTGREVNQRLRGFYGHPEPRIEMHEIIGDDLPLRPSENYAIEFSDIEFANDAGNGFFVSFVKNSGIVFGHLVNGATNNLWSKN